MKEIIFIYEETETIINCNEEEYMKDIIDKVCIKIGIKIDCYDFIYEGNIINFQLKFIEQFKQINMANKIKIIINKKNNIKNKDNNNCISFNTIKDSIILK